MSPGRRRSAASAPSERIYIEPSERRHAMLDVIAQAERRLVLSLFRCNDYGILDAIAAALERGVKVEAILTKRAKGGKKSLKKLWEALGEMGAVVHWYADPVVKYHAKYVVADERLAMIATLNPTKKCFTHTWDFVLTTDDKDVVRSVSTLFALDAAGEHILPRHRLSRRLIVGPEDARPRMREFIQGARRKIQILDHKLSDPDLVAMLRDRRSAGVEVEIAGRQPVGTLVPHGKLFIADESSVLLGSMALSTLSLDFRREVSIVVEAPHIVRALGEFYREISERGGGVSAELPGDAAA